MSFLPLPYALHTSEASRGPSSCRTGPICTTPEIVQGSCLRAARDRTSDDMQRRRARAWREGRNIPRLLRCRASGQRAYRMMRPVSLATSDISPQLSTQGCPQKYPQEPHKHWACLPCSRMPRDRKVGLALWEVYLGSTSARGRLLEQLAGGTSTAPRQDGERRQAHRRRTESQDRDQAGRFRGNG